MKTLNLYCVFDTVSKTSICVMDSPNHGVAIRNASLNFSKSVPLGDIRLYHVGTVDVETMEIIPCPATVVDWNEYKFPENPMKKENQ